MNDLCYCFRIAELGDAEHILSLYQSAKSDAFCVWNDCYPTSLEIEHDLEKKNLYVMTDGGKIVGQFLLCPKMSWTVSIAGHTRMARKSPE